MKYITYNILHVFIISTLLTGCIQKENEVQKVDIGQENNFIVIADTIINDVIIKNPDYDEWTDHSLKNLDKETLIDEIFNSVYKGDLIPYEFFENTPLDIDYIKTLEKDPEFSRDNIAKVQFEEAWYYDSENQKMIKKVYSIMLAYEVYNLQGEIKGYKPAFKVYFK